MPKLDWETWNAVTIRAQLLNWYARNRRDLPWRRTTDPYAIWVSEIMLQQTRVAVVIERYQAFMARFPTLISLALAPEQDVLALWSGLGYYRRARMLHKAAQFVAEHRQGSLPTSAGELRALPGIGAYTSAAIASIANGECVAVVDGNVVRVLCRLAGWDASSTKGGSALHRDIQELATHLVDPYQPGNFNQAMMELGAMVCTPRNPQCLVCPLSADCRTRGEHKTTPPPPMQSRQVAHALSLRADPDPSAERGSREVLLEQRPPSVTIMPGLWELPSIPDPAVAQQDLWVTVRHAIMQVNYYVHIRNVCEDEVPALTVPSGERRWVSLNTAATMALTGLTRKVLSRAHLLPVASLNAIARPPEIDVV